MHIQRLTWAGIKIEVGDTTLFIDAIEDAPNWRSGEGPVIKLSARTASRHAAITHAHTDHYDHTTLATILGEDGSLICPRPIVDEVSRKTLRVRGVELHEAVLLDWLSADIMAIPVPASDGWGDPQVSWIIDADGRRIIHCGDTIWHGYWWNIARQYGPFDLAFMPINGVTYNRGRFTGSQIPATLTPEQAVTAGQILGAKRICPIHFGMHDPGHYVEFPDARNTFLKIAQERGASTLLLKPGEWVDWETLEA
ncbi:MAG TPA: MBL fold metallo-hydrolase [Ktedonobacteraceae bacterium]|nr:MBL fold metallo-hydrolase [Ktedonobacteraceae bacterium]